MSTILFSLFVLCILNRQLTCLSRAIHNKLHPSAPRVLDPLPPRRELSIFEDLYFHNLNLAKCVLRSFQPQFHDVHSGPSIRLCRSFAFLSLGRPPHFRFFPEPPAFLAVDVVSLSPGRLLAFYRKRTKRKGFSRIGPGLFREV